MRPARALVLLALSSAAFGFQSPTPVTLRRMFQKDAVEKYVQVTTNESESSPVPMDFTMRSELKRTYTKVDDKGADFTTETVSVKMEPDPGQDLPRPTLKGRVDVLGVLSELKSETATNVSAANDMMAAFTAGKNPDGVTLPDKPVKPGDTWTFKPGFTEALNADGDYVFTFQGEKEFEGKKCWYVTGVGSFTLKGKDGASPTDMASLMASMKGTMNFTVEAYLDKADCSPRSSLTKGVTSLTLPAMGVEVSTRSTVSLKRA